MLRIQPLSLFPDGPNDYRVKCMHDGKIVEYVFTMEPWTDTYRNMVSSEKPFFYVSHDDWARDWLVGSIFGFDNARHHGIELNGPQTRKVHPYSLTADEADPSGKRYKVVFETQEKEIECNFDLTFEDKSAVVNSEYGSWRAKWDGFRFWEEIQGEEDLTRAILLFHQTRRIKYSDDGVMTNPGLY